MGKGAVFLAFLFVLAVPCSPRAEHEVYYRYTVLGYVKDGAGQERPGIPVELVRLQTGFSYLDRTDQTGFYVIIARLGDDSAGEKLDLVASGRRLTITARFDPANHTLERGTRVDFVGDRPVETPAAFAATLQRFLAR
jgi:hypothetical protein